MFILIPGFHSVNLLGQFSNILPTVKIVTTVHFAALLVEISLVVLSVFEVCIIVFKVYSGNIFFFSLFLSP